MPVKKIWYSGAAFMLSTPKKISIGICVALFVAIIIVSVARVSFANKITTSTLPVPSTSISSDVVRSDQVPADLTQIYKTPVLVYHTIAPIGASDSASVKRFKVTPETFEKQLQYLRDNGYTTITFGSFVDAIKSGRSIPDKTVVLTFDDALDTQYANAFPLLKKYNMTGTFFVYTLVLGHKKFMTWDQVIEVDKAGIEIGSHTKTHAYLIKADAEGLVDEIAGSKKTIEEHLGHGIATLAYPFYQYNETVMTAVQSAGYAGARAGWKKNPNSFAEMYSLQGIEVSNDFSKFPGYLR